MIQLSSHLPGHPIGQSESNLIIDSTHGNRLVLAIETSCDDTSVALVGGKEGEMEVLSLRSLNQDQVHKPFGGIVPEIASRNHSYYLLPLIEETLKECQVKPEELLGIAVTNRPGLVGSLIVGVVTAKTLAQIWKKPFIGVNHLEGHIWASFQSIPREPFLALAVSGGHTTLYLVHEFGNYEVLGNTLDDAAGEAFDKFAKMLGLGFPGGLMIDQWAARGGDICAYEFPRPLMLEDSFAMSFSGLKTAGRRLVETLSKREIATRMPDLCASFQEAIVDVLIAKLDRAVQKTGIQNTVLTGGVSANSRLRKKVSQWAFDQKLQLRLPALNECTDNAAMIGFVGKMRLERGEQSKLSLGPSPNSYSGDFHNAP